MSIAKQFGKNTNVAAKKVISIMRDAVVDFRKIMRGELTYEVVEYRMIAEIKQAMNTWLKHFMDEAKRLDIEFSYQDIIVLDAVVKSVASISWGEVIWQLLYGYEFDDETTMKDALYEMFDFLDNRVYNILRDGLYKVTRDMVYTKLKAKDSNMLVKWYSMNDEFHHPICKEREKVGSVKLIEVPTVFENMHEEGYNYLHPHFLCDGIFLPE